MAWLDALMRILHLGSMAVLVGGLTFRLVALGPALRPVSEEVRNTVTSGVHKQFRRLVHSSIALLLISGAYNWVANAEAYQAAGPAAHGVLGTKVLLALVVFGVVFGLDLGWLKRPWLSVALVLAAIVIVLAASVHTIREQEASADRSTSGDVELRSPSPVGGHGPSMLRRSAPALDERV